MNRHYPFTAQDLRHADLDHLVTVTLCSGHTVTGELINHHPRYSTHHRLVQVVVDLDLQVSPGVVSTCTLPLAPDVPIVFCDRPAMPEVA